jgi:hypothetical protein
MNDNPEPADQPKEPQIFRHEKVITPLDISIQPSEIVTPQQSPQSADVASPLQQQNDIPVPNTANEKRHKLLSVLKLTGISILGLIAGISLYFVLIQGISSSLLDLARMQASFYRPNAVLDKSSVMVQLIVLIVVYWLLLHFIFRSQRSFKQSASALLISQLITIGMVALTSAGYTSIHIIGLDLLFSALVGACVFNVCHYLAEKPWTWKISRLQVTILTIIAVTALDFTCSAYASNRHTELQQQAKKQQATAAAKIKDDTSLNGNNSTGYELFYPNTKAQKAFTVTSASVGSSGNSPDDFDAQLGVPPFSEVDFTNIAWSKNTLHLYMFKPNQKAFNPPSYCGSADPTKSIPIDYGNKSSGLDYSCYKIANIPGMGTLYGAVPGASPTNNDAQQQELAQGLYIAYYAQTSKTLLTLDNSPVTNANNKIEMLTSKDAIGFFSNLAAISPSDLLAKSQQLAANQKAAQASPQAPTYTVYTPTNTAGLTLKSKSIDHTDPSNPVVVLNYFDGNYFDTSNIGIEEYAKPSSFNPPNCGGGPYGAETCQQVGQTTSGKAVYFGSFNYWVDFGNTIISVDGLQQNQMDEALQFYNGMQATTIQTLKLQ